MPKTRISQNFNPTFRCGFCTLAHPSKTKHHKQIILACAIILHAGCMHTRCSGTSNTEHATSRETGNGSSSSAAVPATTAASSTAFSLKKLQQAGGTSSDFVMPLIARDFRPFLLAIESTCCSIMACNNLFCNVGQIQQQLIVYRLFSQQR